MKPRAVSFSLWNSLHFHTMLHTNICTYLWSVYFKLESFIIFSYIKNNNLNNFHYYFMKEVMLKLDSQCWHMISVCTTVCPLFIYKYVCEGRKKWVLGPFRDLLYAYLAFNNKTYLQLIFFFVFSKQCFSVLLWNQSWN